MPLTGWCGLVKLKSRCCFLQLTMKKWSMFGLIFVGGFISYIIVPEAGIIDVG